MAHPIFFFHWVIFLSEKCDITNLQEDIMSWGLDILTYPNNESKCKILMYVDSQLPVSRLRLFFDFTLDPYDAIPAVVLFGYLIWPQIWPEKCTAVNLSPLKPSWL